MQWLLMTWHLSGSRASAIIIMTWASRQENLNVMMTHPHNLHPIACLWEWDMGYLLWIQNLILGMPESLQRSMEYHVILNVIMAPDIQIISCYTGPHYNSTWLYLELLLGSAYEIIFWTHKDTQYMALQVHYGMADENISREKPTVF